jgi:hypothetical protein
MIKLARGYASPFPTLPLEGSVLQLAGIEHNNLEATVLYSANDLSPSEIAALRTGKIRIGIFPFKLGGHVLPIFIVKHEQGYFECPFALGLETFEDQQLITSALKNVHKLGPNATWPLNMISTEMQTNEVAAIRLASLTPRFWKHASEAILASKSITPDVQNQMLRVVYTKYPRSQDLFKRARHQELWGRREAH